MSYKIILDSCGELPEAYKNDEHFQNVPLGLEVGDYQILDDENFNQKEFLQKVAAYSKCAKSSCPSPEKYMESYRTDAEHVYVVTLSGNLSGSYNSAVLGKNLYHETYGEKDIYVVDSCSASCGETQIALLAQELEEENKYTFEEIVERLEAYKNEMHTYFILDNLETLRKNGRLSAVKAVIASTLSIKPVMGANNEGVIQQLSQAIGMKKGIQKMADIIVNEVSDTASKRLMITHCNCPERAEYTREMLEKRAKWREIMIFDTAGISSMYANDGGIIVTV
ncbi:MAG: DegV family protein [Lachnospiraceae bacterium]|nr:DegV family protein [Lachnospiraceae bacterium]